MNNFFQRNLSRFVTRYPDQYVVLECHDRGVRIASHHTRERDAYRAAGAPDNDYAIAYHIPVSLPPKPKSLNPLKISNS